MTPAAWAFLAFCVLALGVAIWMNNTRKPYEIPEFTPETPSLPRDFHPAPTRKRSAKDRLVLAQRRAHAREVCEHDQAVRS